MATRARGHRLQQRAEALHFRIRGLTMLRRLVDLPGGLDITDRQWAILEPQLSAASAQLTSRLKTATGQLLPRVHGAGARVRLNAALGRIELDLAKGYAFFDTYMDVLTQRRATELGAVLGGCDVLAYDAMRRPHPSLDAIEPPLVYCDRGFGAAIVRESVPFPDGSPNPMPLIQIPYSRLREKANLTSILHEAGHQSLNRLGLVRKLGAAFNEALAAASAPRGIRDLYALWSFEIGPDFWGFGLSGMAEAASVRDLFAMPPGPALRVSFTDPHPPPYLRTLLTFDWCRRAWGRGPWNEWEREWIELYPLGALPPGTRRLIVDARRYVPVVGAALFERKFAELNGRALVDLFDLDKVSPANVRRLAGGVKGGVLDLRGLPPCGQLAVFSAVRESRIVSDEYLDRLMTEWLRRLGAQRRVLQ